MGALEIGVPLSVFWHLNPRSLSWHHRAARARAEEEMTRLYAAESLSRAKRLPGLNKWLGKDGPQAKRSGNVVHLGGPRDFMRHLAGRSPGTVVKGAANG